MHVYYRFLQLLSEAKQIAGVSAIMNPGLAEMLGQRVIEGVPVDLLVNPVTISLLEKEPYRSQVNALAAFDNFRVWVTERPIGYGLTVTDSAVSLGFYKRDAKIYDSSTDLFSRDPAAIAWGRALFEHLRGRRGAPPGPLKRFEGFLAGSPRLFTDDACRHPAALLLQIPAR